MPSSFVRSSSRPAIMGKYNPMTAGRGKTASPFSMDTRSQLEDIMSAVGGQKGLVDLFQMKTGPDMGAAALMSGAQGLMSGSPVAGALGFLSSALMGGIDQKHSQAFAQNLLKGIGIGESGQTFTNTFGGSDINTLARMQGLNPGALDPRLMQAANRAVQSGSYGGQNVSGPMGQYLKLASSLLSNQGVKQQLAGPQFGQMLSSVQDYY